MRVTDRLISDTQKKAGRAALPADDDETDEYMERRRQPFLNEMKSVFDQNSFDGINTAGSVFDRQAVFHTGKKKGGN